MLTWVFAGFVALSATVILLLAFGPLRELQQVRFLKLAAAAQYLMAGVLAAVALRGGAA